MKNLQMRHFLSLFVLLLSADLVQAQRLTELLLLADSTNPAIEAARFKYEAALEQAGGAGVLPDPQLSLSVAGSHIETRLGPQQGRATLMQMLPWFGSLNAEKQREALMADAAFQEYQQGRNQLFYQLSLSYFDLYLLRKQKLLLNANLVLMKSMEEVAVSRFQEGNGEMTEALKIQIGREELERKLQLLDVKEQSMSNVLNLALNRQISTRIEMPDTLLLTQVEATIDQNPQLLALAKMEEANKFSTELARIDGYPQVGIGFDYILIGKGEGISSPENGKDAWMPMLTLGLPVFRKKYRSAVKASEMMQQSYQSEIRSTENELAAELEMANYEMAEYLAMNEILGNSISRTKQILAIRLASYAADGTGFNELLQTQQTLLDYQLEKEKILVETMKAESRKRYLSNRWED